MQHWVGMGGIFFNYIKYQLLNSLIHFRIVGELHNLETQESAEMDCVKKFKKLS